MLIKTQIKAMFKTRKVFLLLYAIIWVLVLISPYLRYIQDIGPNSWNRMIGDWTNLGFLFLLFLVNLLVLVPKLLLNGKRSQYAVILIVMIAVGAVVNAILHPPMMPPSHPGMDIQPLELQSHRLFGLIPFLGSVPYLTDEYRFFANKQNCIYVFSYSKSCGCFNTFDT